MSSDAISDYVRKFSEPVAQTLLSTSIAQDLRRYRYALTIPACGEGTSLIGALDSIPVDVNHATLAVVVINGRENAAPSVWQENHASLAAITERYNPPLRAADILRLHRHGNLDLLVVDRAEDFPKKQGVGLARRIGLDLISSIFAGGQIERPIAFMTDADARLPQDYFTRIGGDEGETVAAYVYPFEHHPPEGHDEASLAIQAAAKHYHAFLQYYVDGLAYAGSPYAFQTVGSTIAVSLSAYAKVRGMPRREAGEDFYFLNKLRKQGDVVSLGGEPIALSGRISHRVPFGTGKAIGDLVSGTRSELVYHPRIFEELRQLLALVEGRLVATGHRELSALCASLATESGIFNAIDRARDASDHIPVRQKHFSDFFDAFQTRKFVHQLRDGNAEHPGIGVVPLDEAIEGLRTLSTGI